MDGWCILGISASYTWFRGIVSLRTHTHTHTHTTLLLRASCCWHNLIYLSANFSSLAPRRGPQIYIYVRQLHKTWISPKKRDTRVTRTKHLFFCLKNTKGKLEPFFIIFSCTEFILIIFKCQLVLKNQRTHARGKSMCSLNFYWSQ